MYQVGQGKHNSNGFGVLCVSWTEASEPESVMGELWERGDQTRESGLSRALGVCACWGLTADLAGDSCSGVCMGGVGVETMQAPYFGGFCCEGNSSWWQERRRACSARSLGGQGLGSRSLMQGWSVNQTGRTSGVTGGMSSTPGHREGRWALLVAHGEALLTTSPLQGCGRKQGHQRREGGPWEQEGLGMSGQHLGEAWATHQDVADLGVAACPSCSSL